MSDRELTGNEDLSLPKATVAKILTEILDNKTTPNMSTSKDFRDALTECAVEFITLIASEANEISEREAKKTISAEHVTAALETLGFPEYIAAVNESGEEYKKQMAAREKKQSKMEQSGLTEEELIRQQQELFASATNKYYGNSAQPAWRQQLFRSAVSGSFQEMALSQSGGGESDAIVITDDEPDESTDSVAGEAASPPESSEHALETLKRKRSN